MRIRRKRRITATTMRSHRSGGVHAAIYVAYTKKNRFEAPTSRVPVAAAICRHGRCEYAENCAYVIFCGKQPHPSRLRRATFPRGEGFVAAGCRRYGEVGLRAPCGVMLFYAMLCGGVDAAATEKRDRVFLAELCSCTQCPMAADCRRYGEAGLRAPCGVMILCAMFCGGVDAAAAEYSNAVP